MFCGSMCQIDGISCKMQACGVSAYSVRVRIIRFSFNVGFMVSGGGWSQQKSQDFSKSCVHYSGIANLLLAPTRSKS